MNFNMKLITIFGKETKKPIIRTQQIKYTLQYYKTLQKQHQQAMIRGRRSHPESSQSCSIQASSRYNGRVG